MFKIGDFSKFCRVPVSALRYYADIGLLEPINIDKFTGYRYYSLTQLPRLNRILALKDLGLSLEQIKRLMNDAVSPEEIRGMLKMQQAKIQQQLEEEQARLLRVSTRLSHIEKEGKMPENEVVLKSVEKQHTLAVRYIAHEQDTVGEMLGKAAMAVMQKGIHPVSPPMTIFHDPEFKPNDLDVETVLPVDKAVTESIPLDDDHELSVRVLEAIEAATIIHKGSYDDFPQTYATLGTWIENNGYQVAGPPREIYLSPPSEEEFAVTEIQYPISKA